MTVQTVGWVLDHSPSRGYARLVLISLANHANRHGAQCFPSLQTIADEAGVSRSTAWRAIEALEAAGELLIRRAIGRSNVNRYVLVMGRDPIGCADLFDHPEPPRSAEPARPRPPRPPGPNGDGTKGVPAEHLARTECSREEQLAPAKSSPVEHLADPNVPEMFHKCFTGTPSSRARVLLDFKEPQNHLTGGTPGGVNVAREVTSPIPPPAAVPIPADLAMSDDDANAGFAAGLARAELDAEWRHFRHHYAARQDVCRTDWHAAWRSWLAKIDRFAARRRPSRSTAAAGELDALRAYERRTR